MASQREKRCGSGIASRTGHPSLILDPIDPRGEVRWDRGLVTKGRYVAQIRFRESPGGEIPRATRRLRVPQKSLQRSGVWLISSRWPWDSARSLRCRIILRFYFVRSLAIPNDRERRQMRRKLCNTRVGYARREDQSQRSKALQCSKMNDSFVADARKRKAQPV